MISSLYDLQGLAYRDSYGKAAMKKIFFALLLIILLVFVSAIVVTYKYRNWALRYAIEEIVSSELPGSSLSLGASELHLPNRLAFSKIDLKIPQYDIFIDIDRIELDFQPSKLLEYIEMGTANQILKNIFIDGKSIQYKEVRIKKPHLEARLNTNEAQTLSYTGFMTSSEFFFKKIKMEEVKTECSLKNNTLQIDIFHMLFSGGMVTGTIEAVFGDDGFEYTAHVKMKNLKAGDMMIILNLEKKLQMSGVWNGTVNVKGSSGKGITAIDGNLVADPQGGELVITDQAMIDNIASRAGIAKDEVARSLAHHDYDEGSMNLGMEENAVKLNLSLSGDTGDRNFDIYLHDFLD